MSNTLDTQRLEEEVKTVYRNVANSPENDYHFEMGRTLAERLGYPTEDLDRIPSEALESFAGVGYHFDYARIAEGDSVLDLGSGSGTDVFVAALYTGSNGSVTGIDMTNEQLEKSRALRDAAGMDHVHFEKGYIEDLPFDDDEFDVVISNGVINLSPDKDQVFEEVHRVLRSGGTLAISDIISERQMPDSIKSDADLWASCIGGAEQIDAYTSIIERAGFDVTETRDNSEYEFISEAATNACQKYGVKSGSFKATVH